jgi:hypothetical protein
MSNKHQLSLEIPDSNNIKVLRLFDTSFYADNVNVDCSTLRITSPGFNLPIVIDVLPSFNLVLNACSLGIQRSGCGTNSMPLPDGIYVINYSVSPNDKVYVEYNYLRTTQIMNKYYGILGQLEMASCEPAADVKEMLNELRLIKSFIDAAKAKVEYTLQPEAGMDLFIYAKKRLDRLTSNDCVNC